ncbi:MAG: PadR family transcriptional regulator [Clostridia bacterium]|nr:PadR family transcriptional regulator [Clostridia bacterium]MDE7216347.1 PadR family transcriptional regulator [Clostridia bacterium]MDE7337109.1 PadR family transcriptional regulator [Clostridia bacterium]
MDSQLKKGLLEGCVLAAIRDEESYGYKIIGQLSPYIEISESTLYPILKRLESSKCVVTKNKLYNGRLRKYYRITDRGKAKLREFCLDMEQIMEIYRFLRK